MNKLRIGYFADGPWSHEAFRLLIQDISLEIAFIVPRTDSTDATLNDFSKEFGIGYHKGYDINSTEFYNLADSYQCDLFVSMSFNQIFRKRIMRLPRLHTINCHAGKLPFYRGRNILNWALINDETEFGITVHFIDEGIDTGDIILQKIFPISDEDTYKTLLHISYSQCARILYDAIKIVQSGSYRRIKQTEIHPTGFYCGPRSLGDEIINWNSSSRELFNFIRAVCDPGPRAHTTLNEQIIKINASTMVENACNYKCINGQIVGKTSKGFFVKTSDSILEIYDIESPVKIKIGDRLGT